jgi:hypothetical protein
MVQNIRSAPIPNDSFYGKKQFYFLGPKRFVEQKDVNMLKATANFKIQKNLFNHWFDL